MTSASARTGSRIRRSSLIELRDPPLVVERMAVAGLAEAADQDVVAGLEEHDAGHDPPAFEGAAHRGQGERGIPGADVDHDGDLGEPVGFGRDEVGEVREQLTGEVVDDGVAQVLEQLRGRGLAAAREPGQDHDRLIRGTLVDGRLRGFVHRPVRRMNTTVSSNSRYIVPPSTNGLTRSPPGVATAEKMAMPRIT